MQDIDVKMTISHKQNKIFTDEEIREFTYIINEACTKLENLKCDVFYKILVDGVRFNSEF